VLLGTLVYRLSRSTCGSPLSPLENIEQAWFLVREFATSPFRLETQGPKPCISIWCMAGVDTTLAGKKDETTLTCTPTQPTRVVLRSGFGSRGPFRLRSISP
jgi:hypothetical protein